MTAVNSVITRTSAGIKTDNCASVFLYWKAEVCYIYTTALGFISSLSQHIAEIGVVPHFFEKKLLTKRTVYIKITMKLA